MNQKQNVGWVLLAFLFVGFVLRFLYLGPIAQQDSYHGFSDVDTYLGIPNFWNVVSNIPFLVVGILGLSTLNRYPAFKLPYITFFTGIGLVCMGSIYYHLEPSNSRLVWDRLPMTLGFTALFCVVVLERIGENIARILFYPALLLGLFSVWYWQYIGDLRLYFFVQFFPLVAIPIVLLFFKSNSAQMGYWGLLGFYILAKVLEYYDVEVYSLTGWIGGHSLKHLVAALGLFCFYFLSSLQSAR